MYVYANQHVYSTYILKNAGFLTYKWQVIDNKVIKKNMYLKINFIKTYILK